MGAHLSGRTIRRALGVLEELPTEALADLVERLIERLDLAEGDLDREPDDFDGCQAEDFQPNPLLGIGDADDVEDSDEDLGAAEDEGPIDGTLLPAEPFATLFGKSSPGRVHGGDDVWVPVR